jgi:hypothetical protein
MVVVPPPASYIATCMSSAYDALSHLSDALPPPIRGVGPLPRRIGGPLRRSSHRRRSVVGTSRSRPAPRKRARTQPPPRPPYHRRRRRCRGLPHRRPPPTRRTGRSKSGTTPRVSRPRRRRSCRASPRTSPPVAPRCPSASMRRPTTARLGSGRRLANATVA